MTRARGRTIRKEAKIPPRYRNIPGTKGDDARVE